jgi:UDP-GlcNAc3NAcA epimerase
VPGVIRMVTVVGARPQFIKAAVVSRAIRGVPAIQEQVIHTGQHYDGDMSAVFFDELEMPQPYRNLGVGSGSHAVQTARMLEALEAALHEEMPDVVLVYGDTNSTLAAALAAAKIPIPVAHVEAGVRSFNREMPEEINRIATDHVAEVLFPPTRSAAERLVSEGLGGRTIVSAGDVMYDAVLHAAARGQGRMGLLERLDVPPRGYVLATIHRAENTDAPTRLSGILDALATISRELPVVLPLHPRTRSAVERLRPGGLSGAGIRVITPVGYMDMQVLESQARVMVTDSGGLQKEAYWHGVPCVTVRHETEWTELVEAGWNRLAAPEDSGAIVRAVRAAADTPDLPRPAFFGDGHAGERIVAALVERFG